jgi:hypothetical protein
MPLRESRRAWERENSKSEGNEEKGRKSRNSKLSLSLVSLLKLTKVLLRGRNDRRQSFGRKGAMSAQKRDLLLSGPDLA